MAEPRPGSSANHGVPASLGRPGRAHIRRELFPQAKESHYAGISARAEGQTNTAGSKDEDGCADFTDHNIRGAVESLRGRGARVLTAIRAERECFLSQTSTTRAPIRCAKRIERSQLRPTRAYSRNSWKSAGQGDASRFEREADRTPLAEKVRLLPWQQYDAARDILSSSDVVPTAACRASGEERFAAGSLLHGATLRLPSDGDA
eukprot:4754321-Pleurochrysis_carterae.AAC.1